MRIFYVVTGVLVFFRALPVLFAVAGTLFFVAGLLDLFLYDNQAPGLIAALTGVIVLGFAHTLELWLKPATAKRSTGTPSTARKIRTFPTR
jgi:hypothetical protein